MSYINFLGPFRRDGQKTCHWEVVSKDGGGELGAVKWFGRWRCYAFFPNPDTVFERKCLRDIADFCEGETQRHRERL